MTKFARVASLFVGTVLLISACDRAADIAAPRSRPASARAKLIAGEPRFYFLRPIARKTSFTGEFDATLSPVVEICVWQANACALPLVSRLTNVKVRGADEDDDDDDAQVEVESNAHYGVKWKTKGLHLDPAKAYRIRVLVAGAELGFADVDVVKNAKQARNVDTAHFVPLVVGKSLKIRFRIEKDTVDSLPPDSLPPDSLPPDSLPPDSLPPDSLPPDSLPPDSLPPDSLPPDSLPPDSLPPDSLPPDSLPPVVQYDSGSVAAGLNHSCAIAISGVSYCWGANAFGALGNNTTTPSNVPAATWGGHSFRVLSAGSADTTHAGAHSCALDGAGHAFCWGLNNHGQLGNGFTFPQDTAHPIVSDSTFKSISAGRTYTCAVTLGGAAFCWGRGHVGQLGNGAQTGSLVPIPVFGALTFSMISAGDAHTCGVTISGDVYCWGSNGRGQIGIGTTGVPKLVPQFVIGGFQWVSAGPEHTCGVKTTGQVYCWGRNNRGQLGDGTQVDRSLPVAVGGGLGTGYKRVDAGGRTSSSVQTAYSCGLKVSGDAYCWGSNVFGQLGNGGNAVSVYVVPSPVLGGHKFRNVSTGVEHTCGVTWGGSVYCWGSNADGNLGNAGAPAPFATPVLVSGGLFYY